MATYTLPAIGNSLNRFFSYSSGAPNNPQQEIRLYQCEKKVNEIGYTCMEQTSEMLISPESKIIGIPSYFPKQLDYIILQAKLYSP